TSANRSCSVKNISTSGEDSSSASVNNDWKHWVVMHGNEQLAMDDVCGIGKAIGVKFNKDNVNMFSANMLSALARSGKGKKVSAEYV
ncbi:sulfate transporter, partial [Trifolium medium]|nr:sulfate transporter [Trifolium medium]